MKILKNKKNLKKPYKSKKPQKKHFVKIVIYFSALFNKKICAQNALKSIKILYKNKKF